MELSKHGRKRVEERAGIGKSEKKTDRMAKLALERGYKHSETKGSLKKFLDGKFLYHNRSANNMRVYSGQLWLFHDDKLITVIPLPSKFQKDIQNYVTRKVEP